MSVRLRDLDALSPPERHALLARQDWLAPEVLERCRTIVADVRARGDAALVELTRRFDGVDLGPVGLRVTPAQLEDAVARLDPRVAAALDVALANVTRFHAAQACGDLRVVEVAEGLFCGERTTPVDSAALYVPRGRGSFASVALMLGVPARLAGVPRVVLCTPPGPLGAVDAATLYVARRLGIDEVVRVGGAQAVAAVAHGTESVERCDKLVGPGNVHVSAARVLLSDVIDTGTPAGPSESLILADGSADPGNAAWNLLVEAEHGENSCAVLVATERSFAERVARAVERCLPRLAPGRRRFAETVLAERGGILVARDLDAALDFANEFAAEHVALMVRDPWAVLPRLRHAGEVLLGDYPLFSLANYALGLNAILPTGGLARTRSGVSVRDFQKRTSVGWVTEAGFARLCEVVPVLSRDEGFSAHHEAVLAWRGAGGS